MSRHRRPALRPRRGGAAAPRRGVFFIGAASRQAEMRMDVEQTIEIDAPRKTVWAVMIDVERWPEWTPTTTSVELLDRGPFVVGSRARIRQPRLPVVIWTVTTLESERYFE